MLCCVCNKVFNYECFTHLNQLVSLKHNDKVYLENLIKKTIKGIQEFINNLPDYCDKNAFKELLISMFDDEAYMETPIDEIIELAYINSAKR